jgi:hypothetical protein
VVRYDTYEEVEARMLQYADELDVIHDEAV